MSQHVDAPGGPPTELAEGIRNPAARAIVSQGGPGFIEVLGLQLLAGRTLEPGEACERGRARCRVVVDERFAEVFFPGETAVGQVFDIPGVGIIVNGEVQALPSREVVGLVANARHEGPRADALPTIYQLLDPLLLQFSDHLAIRAEIDSGALAAAVEQAVARVDPAVPLAELHTQSGLVDRLLRTERLLALVSGAFGLAALALAAVGLGGLLAYAVARRTNEIGIRMALGATDRQVQRMVLGDSLRMVGAGVLIGVPAAWAVGRYLESLLYGLEPMDPSTTSASLLALIVIAGMAALLPARRAARVNPLTALREE